MIDASTDALRFHASMLRDRDRTEAFRVAIEATVRPGDVVCDIGTGTGILALFAARAGARRVYAVEAGPMASAAREVVAANGLAGRVEVLHGRSTELTLPEAADVVLSETLWNAGVGEGIVTTFDDARERLARPGAAMVPQRFAIVIAPVEAASGHRIVDTWTDDVSGFDLRSLRALAANAVHAHRLAEHDLLAAPQVAASMDLRSPYPGPALARLAYAARRDGVLHGIGAWFRAVLAPGVEIENAPGNGLPSWQHALLPLAEPVRVTAGTHIQAELWVAADGEEWRWAVEVGGRRQAQATLRGQLLSLERLTRAAPARRPTPSSRGRALRELLAAADGTRTTAQLVDLMLERAPDAFASPSHAQAFVRAALEEWT